MPRVCLLLALAVAFVLSVALGPSSAESTLLWWHKALFAIVGGAMAMILLRLLPEPRLAPEPSAERKQPRE